MSSSPPAITSPTTSTSSASDNLTKSRRKRVSAEHTLNRVRENQRRHRARRKDYISTLEQKLAETEQQLEEARAEIAALKAERNADICVQFDRAIQQSSPSLGTKDGDGNATRQNEQSEIEEGLSKQQELASIQLRPAIEYPDVRDASPLGADQAQTFLLGPFDLSSIPSDLSTLSPSAIPNLELAALPSTAGPPPCCEVADTSSLPDPSDPECSNCKTRPAPSPTESTTLCAQAYVMIQQQNFRGIDAATIRLWLGQGYRRAQKRGEGCRVENGALFRLLDYISGV